MSSSPIRRFPRVLKKPLPGSGIAGRLCIDWGSVHRFTEILNGIKMTCTAHPQKAVSADPHSLIEHAAKEYDRVAFEFSAFIKKRIHGRLDHPATLRLDMLSSACDCQTFQCPIHALVAMGRCNKKLEPALH